MRRALSASPDTLRRLAYSDPESFPILLDSAAAGPLGRYSILAAYPQATLWLDQARRLHTLGLVSAQPGGFLAALELAWRAEQPPQGLSEVEDGILQLPFTGGWMVYLGYEMHAEIEPRLGSFTPAQSDAAGPLAFALRIPAGIVYDHLANQAWGFASGEPAGSSQLLDRLQRAVTRLPPVGPMARIDLTLQEEAPERFRSRVASALEHIAAGDVYQANLSRPWRAELPTGESASSAAPALYESLRQSNPAPFAALAQFRQWRLLSSSPERLVRVSATRVDTRPIAGTRPRSGIEGQDQLEIEALIANDKERAEHVMLIDLERNDLGRVCRAGSVQVDEFMVIESYPHVHHMVSNVSGERRPELTPTDILRAVFPGGTITGCPKFRCMQIIAALEGEARGAYTGALGYITCDGRMDFNILIRSLTLNERRLEFRTGAGIVADSSWQRELAETRAKARGLLRALGQA